MFFALIEYSGPLLLVVTFLMIMVTIVGGTGLFIFWVMRGRNRNRVIFKGIAEKPDLQMTNGLLLLFGKYKGWKVKFEHGLGRNSAYAEDGHRNYTFCETEFSQALRCLLKIEICPQMKSKEREKI